MYYLSASLVISVASRFPGLILRCSCPSTTPVLETLFLNYRKMARRQLPRRCPVRARHFSQMFGQDFLLLSGNVFSELSRP